VVRFRVWSALIFRLARLNVQSGDIRDFLDLETRHFALLLAGVILWGGFTATLFLAA
jgi:hypothetical protein